MSLDALEQALAAATKQLAKKKIAESREARVAKEKAEEQVAPAFSLTPVFDFYAHVKREPREVLEARYEAMLGQLAPKEARHDWLATRLGYHFQVKYYQAMLGEFCVPRVVLDRAGEWSLTWPYAQLGRPYDEGDPAEVELWDDTYVAAVCENPFARGDARAAFFAVEMAGANGVQFAPLCKTLEGLLNCAVGAAQERALEFFTTKVREGQTKILIRSDA